MKFVLVTIILLMSMFAGWFVAAKYFEPIIFRFFAPETHDDYLEIWFVLFASIELAMVAVYGGVIYRIYRSTKLLKKVI